MRMRYPVVIIAVTLMAAKAGDAGKAGLANLKMPATARSAASMTVFSYTGAGIAGMWDHPTGIEVTDAQAQVSHNRWFADMVSEVVALGLPLSKGSLAISLSHTRIPDIEVREKPSDEPLGTVSAQYYSLGAGYALTFWERLHIGTVLKLLGESLYTENAHGVALDLAAWFKIPGQMDVAVSVQNLGRMTELAAEATRLPVLFDVRVVRPEVFVGGPLSVGLGIDLGSNITTGETRARIGTELRVRELFFMRGGYERAGSQYRSAFGIGLQYERWSIDYAMIFMTTGLDYPRLVTLGYRF